MRHNLNQYAIFRLFLFCGPYFYADHKTNVFLFSRVSKMSFVSAEALHERATFTYIASFVNSGFAPSCLTSQIRSISVTQMRCTWSEVKQNNLINEPVPHKLVNCCKSIGDWPRSTQYGGIQPTALVRIEDDLGGEEKENSYPNTDCSQFR